MDYRTMFDDKYIGAWNLLGADVVVEISEVQPQILKTDRGEVRKPILSFVGKDKGMVCNKTNSRCIAALYGNDTAKWIGKLITLYPTTTSVGGKVVDCIRVRPEIPEGKRAKKS